MINSNIFCHAFKPSFCFFIIFRISSKNPINPKASNEYSAIIASSVGLNLITTITIAVEIINIIPPIVGVPAFFRWL